MKNGQQVDGLRRYEEIHAAVPTDPTVSGPIFEGFAQAYIESIDALEESDTNTVAVFNHMVDICMSCHTKFCPGPRMKISKLYIKE